MEEVGRFSVFGRKQIQKVHVVENRRGWSPFLTFAHWDSLAGDGRGNAGGWSFFSFRIHSLRALLVSGRIEGAGRFSFWGAETFFL